MEAENVLQINTTAEGGAGRVMLWLHAALRARGSQAAVLTRYGAPGQAERRLFTLAEVLGERPGALARLANLAAGRAERWLGLPQLHSSTRRLLNTALWRQASVVHLHNLHGEYFNHALLPRLGREKPLVWTLHDYWALSGWCTFPGDCDRWELGCHHCPQLRERAEARRWPWLSPPDRSRAVWGAKARRYAQTRLHVAAPSRWLFERAQRGILRGASLHHIPNGVDLTVFRPLERGAARARLGLPSEATVVLFAAASVHNRRKGLHLLHTALRQLPAARDWWLVTAGADPRGVGRADREHYLGLGTVTDDERLNLAYNAADVVALPSLAENHPLVLLEALAAGTPAVAFDVGGVSEITRHEHTGYLARTGDAGELARGLEWVLADPARRARLGRKCRALAEAEFNQAHMIARYLDLYAAARAEHA